LESILGLLKKFINSVSDESPHSSSLWLAQSTVQIFAGFIKGKAQREAPEGAQKAIFLTTV
jgi:hypothetical protein